ncbi:MAG: hypothetical protein WBQ43_09010 [Terriglobales bacterium]
MTNFASRAGSLYYPETARQTRQVPFPPILERGLPRILHGRNSLADQTLRAMGKVLFRSRNLAIAKNISAVFYATDRSSMRLDELVTVDSSRATRVI